MIKSVAAALEDGALDLEGEGVDYLGVFRRFVAPKRSSK